MWVNRIASRESPHIRTELSAVVTTHLPDRSIDWRQSGRNHNDVC